MPLSEQEQRLLDEMERNLYHSEADDVTTVGRRGRPNYTAVLLGVIAGALGVALLVVGVVIRQPIVGLLGFAAMFGGSLLAIAPPRRLTIPRDPRTATTQARRSGLFDSLNDRRDHRDGEH